MGRPETAIFGKAIVYVVLGIKPRAVHVLGKFSTTELYIIPQRPAFKVGYWLVFGNLDFRTVSATPQTGKSSSLYFVCVNIMVHGQYLFSFWSLGLRYTVDIGCLCDPLSIKTLGTHSLMSFHGREHLTCIVTTHCWRN